MSRISNPLVIIRKMRNINCGRVMSVRAPANRGEDKRILRMAGSITIVRMFRKAASLGAGSAGAEFANRATGVNMSESVVNHVFGNVNGPVSNKPRVVPSRRLSVGKTPVGPTSHRFPRRFVRANVSAVSTVGALMEKRGLPVFSKSNLPRGSLTIRVTERTGMLNTSSRFTMVFTTVNVAGRRTGFFVESFRHAKTLRGLAMFVGLTSSPTVREVLAPGVTLAATRCCTFALNVRMLIVLASVAGCYRTLERVSTTERRMPKEENCPNCVCASLTNVCRETKHVSNGRNSVARVPVLIVPRSSVARPVPSLANCVARKRVMLDERLSEGNVCPPMSMLPSLSHLVDNNVNKSGAESSRDNMSSRLCSTCTRNHRLESLMTIMKRRTLARESRGFLRFTRTFRSRFVARDGSRSESVFRSLSLN